MKDAWVKLSAKVKTTVRKLQSTLAAVLQTISEQISGLAEKISWVRSWKSVRMRQLGVKTAKTCGRYVSPDSSASAALKQVKKSKMNKDAVKDLMFGGVTELMRNPHFYYFSSVGFEYCHWTEDGKEALQEYMELMAAKFHRAEQESLNKRAKELVIKGLKGEQV